MRSASFAFRLLPYLLISSASFGVDMSTSVDCQIRFGLSSRYHHPNGYMSISFDPQDLLRNPVPGEKVEPGRYDLYVRAAPDGDGKAVRCIDVGLADAVSYVRYNPPAGPQWIGPISLKTSYATDAIELRGSGHVMLDCFRILPSGAPFPEKEGKPVASLPQEGWKTIWVDFPTYPAWFTPEMPVTIRVRTGAPSGTDAAAVNCRIFDYEHKEVAAFRFKVAMNGKQTAQNIPVPTRFGPYLLRFFITMPGVKEFEVQRVVTRVSSPLEFTCDRFGGHGNVPFLRLLGAGWNRLWDSGGGNTHWPNVEPEKGKFTWDDDLPAAGDVKALGMLERAPSWFKKDIYEGSADWLNYVRQTVTHFRGKIPVWEIRNEPYEKPTDEFAKKHVALVKATAKVIRESDPKALVMSGGPPEEIPPGLGWWENLAKQGLLEPIDVIAAHLYFGGGGTYPLDQDLRFDAYATSLRKLCDQYGGKGKVIWDTESGLCPMESFYVGRPATYGLWSSAGFTPRDPVPYLIGTAMAARYVILHFWHDIRWNYYHTTGACYGNSWALCDFDETPLPAAASMAQMIRLLAQAKGDGKAKLPDGLWGVKFKDGETQLAAFWSVHLKPGEKRFVPYPDVARVKVLDMFANPVGKTDRLEVGISPIIFAGAAGVVEKAVSELKVTSEIDPSVTGPAKVSLRLTAPDMNPPAVLTASSAAPGYGLDVLRDEKDVGTGEPKDSWSSAKGDEHWLEYRWPAKKTINRLLIAWPPGEIPKQYKIEWYDGAAWHSCSGTPDWRSPGMPSEDYTITPVETDRLRATFRSKDGRSVTVSEFDAFFIPRLTPPIMEMQEIWSKPFKPSAEGYIRDWLVCGPFPSPGLRYAQQNKPANWDEDMLDTCWIYGNGHGEPVIRPHVGQEHVASFPEGTQAPWKPMDVRVAWQPVHMQDDNRLDLAKCFTNSLLVKSGRIVEQCFGYAACYIDTAADIDGVISIGSDDGYKIWIDDKVVGEKVVFRGANPDQETIPVQIAKGRHRILIKIHNDIGGHELYFRFLDKAGKPVTDYTVHLAP